MNHNIRLYNRATGSFESEVVFEQRFMDVVYGTRFGRFLERHVISKPLFSMIYGVIQSLPSSKKKIREFVDSHDVDDSEFEKSITEFSSFNDFFTRKLVAEARPINQNSKNLISPCDGRLLKYTIRKSSIIPVKGIPFTVEELIGNSSLTEQYHDGQCLVFRLAPADYHRFCFIDNGTKSAVQRTSGLLHSVSPLSLTQMVPALTENVREMTVLNTQNFGDVIHIDVGALVVGKIVQHERDSVAVTRGQEKGYFKFGGSTIIILLKAGCVELDADIVENSEKGIESIVKMGEVIGSSSG